MTDNSAATSATAGVRPADKARLWHAPTGRWVIMTGISPAAIGKTGDAVVVTEQSREVVTVTIGDLSESQP